MWQLLRIDPNRAFADRSRPWTALALAVAAWWVILVVYAVQIFSFAQSPLRMATTALVGRTPVPVLTRDIAMFALAELLIHSAFGVASWLLALASRRAFPRLRVTLIGWVIVWVALSFAAIDAANSVEVPRSYYSEALFRTQLVATVTVADVLLILIGVMIAVTVVRAAWSLGRAVWAIDGVRNRAQPIAACAFTALAGLLWWRLLSADPDAHASREQPHIIVIGLDSLRPDMVADDRGVSLTPNLREFLGGATTFTDAITPLARTFPSWVTILSGKHPVRSGARDNLMPPSLFDPTPTLGQRLRAAGYSTFYATDEVRYSNIDESFGFDRVVSPRIGATDFMITRWADLPASNLLANTRLGQWLLPNLYANRAAAYLYQPDTFLQWVERSVDFSRPTFLAVHLTLAHGPYRWSEREQMFGDGHPRYQYYSSVIGVDRQFAHLMQILKRRGALEQAIVVVLSDHGEALGLPRDVLVSDPEGRAAVGPLVIPNTGHGNGVLSSTQFQVLLALRRFDSAVVDPKPRRSAVPASLEDVAPTVLDLLGIAGGPEEFDGISLAAELAATSPPSAHDSSRVRFTESGLTTAAMRVGNYSEAANVQEAVQFYRLDRQTGRVVFNGDRLNDLFAKKERAAVSGEWLLAAIPTEALNTHQYILVKRSGGVPEVVTTTPDAELNPVFAHLWQALKGRFGEEVTGGGE
jgi:arylsulfatase A-like enzyme